MSTSPTTSAPSRPSSSRASSRASLKLDLSNLPPLTQPVTPTNTLLITNLNDLEIFRPDNLQTIKELICQTAPVNSWSPLKSFRRIVCSFADEQAAIKVRQVWDGEAVMGERCRVYFGQHTPLNMTQDQHLALPDAGKLFFISPPPSPPCGWEMRLEDAPNKQVHAEDLADALAKLHHRNVAPIDSPISPVEGASATTRSRSSTLIFQPNEPTGGSPALPCIAVDDMTDSPMDISPSPIGAEKPILAHTARPPVELMQQ
ncbi:calcipressin family protein [Seiridium cupressi]|uniref:Calcipressin n=1 Tax=Seiridium unicorne TaxID=138068 RepID=A0ABR2VCT8_9PEZI